MKTNPTANATSFTDPNILLLNAKEVNTLLEGVEAELIEAVRAAYIAHGQSQTIVPHSSFLFFPDRKDRWIAIPAYLGGQFDIAGVKWIGSFPENLRYGLDRASAVIILNCTQSGRPKAILEGSAVSAKRTAASAMLAVEQLYSNDMDGILGLIGCGRINYEILRFILASRRITRLIIYDLDPRRAQHFKEKAASLPMHPEIEVAATCSEVTKQASLISIATTASVPHIFSTSEFRAGSLLLHISLRDLSPEFILSCNNFADDIDHVLQANTSLDLAWRSVNHRNFVHGTLPDLLRNSRAATLDRKRITVFSPFGLGILDLALSSVVCERAMQRRIGTYIPWFENGNWSA